MNRHRGCRGVLPVLVVWGLLALSTWPAAEALRLGTRPTADRSAARPLRALDLPALLAGEGDAREVGAALARLPARCQPRQALARDACDEDLRCAWLYARGEVARAWSDQVVGARAEAAEWLHRAAERLAGSGACGRGEARRALWQADRRQAAIDDGWVGLARMMEVRRETAAKVLTGSAERRVEALVKVAYEQGLGAVDADAVAALRGDLFAAAERGRWLLDHPGLDRFRRTLRTVWKPAGGIPEGCGDELFRPDLLADQWRGYLVRDVVPAALSCLPEKLIARLAARGLTVVDADRGKLVAATLEAVAQRDSGGRSFSRDLAIEARLEELEQALEARRQVAARPSPPVRSGQARPSPSPSPLHSPARRAARRPTRTAASTAPQQPSRADPLLIRRAEKVREVLGTQEELVAAARAARTSRARQRLLQRLVVMLHRGVCAPLDEQDPAELVAARQVLLDLGFRAEEGACRAREGEAYLDKLLDAAENLQRLQAVVLMRRAAREVTERSPSLALATLDRVPGRFQGTSWTLLRAWAAREEGDHVTADRLLSRMDEEILDRLRASGQEELARVVAHAWVARTP